MDYQDFVSTTLQSAALIAQKNFGKVSHITKKHDNNQVLTATDIEIGRAIIETIQNNFSDHNIIDEEAGVIDKQSRYTWVVDPIDGTSNFVVGLPTYGIMMGLLEEETPIVGGIILPEFGEIYFGQKGDGAWCNGTQIEVSKVDQLSQVLVTYGIDGYPDDPERTQKETKILGNIIVNIRNLRTTNSAYDMAHTCSGSYGAYLNQTTKIWDNVALQPIIEEAGGIMTDFFGETLNYSNPLKRTEENYTICAASTILHKQLQDIIHSHF
jgi:myo-inositol-1(or 4)-monophosphatase